MLHTSVDWKKIRADLGSRRAELFERFVKNPAEIRLAKEIKLLDDQMVECSQHMERERTHQG
jgi:hypothetical protein